MLHLLVASFRALPLDLMVPVSRRGFVWIFSGIFFLLFVFSLSLFSGFLSIQTRYLSSIVSLDTFAHAHSPEICRQQVPEKVWNDLSLWYQPDLVKTRQSRTSPLVSHFPVTERESGTRWKKKKSDFAEATEQICFLLSAYFGWAISIRINSYIFN